MDVVFGIILFFAFIFLILGLIKPKLAFMKSRKKVLTVYPIVFIVSFIALGVTAESETSKSDETIPVSGKTEKDSEKAESNQVVKEENKDKKKEETKKEEPKKEEKINAKIGDELQVGNALFRVDNIEIANQVGPSFLPQKASGKYLVVSVSYKNGGNDAVTLDSSFFKLKRGEKTYETDSMASMSANQGENGNIDNSFFYQQVNPDMQISGKVVFDLAPEVAEATDLQIQVQTGIFGTETGIIDLK